MQVVLVMFRTDGERRSFSVTRDVTVIGRREDCDLRIPLGEVSRKHCRFIKDQGMLHVEDLGSSNGTYVNGQRVQESPVQAGDTVMIGTVIFVAQIDGTPAEEDLQPIYPGTATAAGEGLNDSEYAADPTTLRPPPLPGPGGDEIEMPGTVPQPDQTQHIAEAGEIIEAEALEEVESSGNGGRDIIDDFHVENDAGAAGTQADQLVDLNFDEKGDSRANQPPAP